MSASQAEFDRLELELRKLPDVVAVGFEGPAVGTPVTDDAILTIHLVVADPEARAAVEAQALDLGRLHLARPLRIVVGPDSEVVGVDAADQVPGHPSRPSRVRLAGVSLVEAGRGVEVTLLHGEGRATGRGASGTPSGAAEATLVALRQLGWSVPFDVGAGVRLAVGATGAVLVHLRGGDGDRLGVSVGETAETAAVKATLQALNRWLDDPARRPMALRPTASSG
ncbi:MAG TPA: hypothetical protein VGI06_02685 [Acidimicrobiales bacterium]